MNPGDILILEMRRNRVKELLDYLLGHDRHSDGGPDRIAWNIKVRCNEGNLSDPVIREEYGLKDKWDERWEEHLKEDHDLFWRACEDGLDFVGDTHDKKRLPWCPWTTKEGDEFLYEIWQAGRSGGWLELHRFEGAEVKLGDLDEQYEKLRETEENYTGCSECSWQMDGKEFKRYLCEDPAVHTKEYYADLEDLLHNEGWLTKLVRFCKSLDEFDASKELEHQLAFRRQELEDEWEEEERIETQKEAEAEELYLEF